MNAPTPVGLPTAGKFTLPPRPSTRPTAVRTTCPYCGVGCGVLVEPPPTADRAPATVRVKGDPQHPANFGRLCVKGTALGETVALGHRLLHPERRTAADAPWESVSWDTALGEVHARLAAVLREHGPQAVAFYVSGQLLTEDYYVANKLMKGGLGTANIDTNSRLCMASSVAGHKRAFGSDTVPGRYTDWEQADLVVLVGTNLAWCHPVLYQRLAAAKKQRPALQVILIDPRKTATADLADVHLPLRSQTDVVLFNGLLAHLHREGQGNAPWLTAHTEGFEAALAAAGTATVAEIAAICGLEPAAVAAFYQAFAATERVVTVYSQGVNQSDQGSDKVNAMVNCHLLTGRIGRVGMGPFSITGQPNAMGGREVGGLANQLAAHMDFAPADRDRVARFWGMPTVAERPGLKAVELFQAIDRGEVRFVWIMGTNPVASLPEADAVKRALARCPHVIVSDVVRDTDTLALAHVRLPALAWGEKSGTVTNSERCISRQIPFLPAPGDAKPDWWMVCEVAKRLGLGDHFAFPSAAAIFREHAALSGFENSGTRDFDISAYATVTDGDYAALPPFYWPAPAASAPTAVDDATAGRFFAAGRFFTPSGRGRFVATPTRAVTEATDAEFPLVLNTGRLRDQWHTMTRTGHVPRLLAHGDEPTLAIHPATGAAYGLAAGYLARVTSRYGAVLAKVQWDEGQRLGEVFLPMHFCAPFARHRVDSLVNPRVDPVSGQPALKHTPVTVAPVEAREYGFLLTRQPLSATALDAFDYWVQLPQDGHWRVEWATARASDRPRIDAAWCLAQPTARPEDAALAVLSYEDPALGTARYAGLFGDQLDFVLWRHNGPISLDKRWLGERFGAAVTPSQRRALLNGGLTAGVVDQGRMICACHQVPLTAITDAIRDGCRTVDDLGRQVQAGTGCGSCIPELRGLLRLQGFAS